MVEKIVWLALLVIAVVFLCLRFDVIHFSQFTPVFLPGLLILTIGGLILVGQITIRFFRKKPFPPRMLGSAILGILPLTLLVFNLVASSNKYPAIHDITTDLDNPPQFHLAIKDRNPKDNPVDYDPANIPVQMESYPDIKSLQTSANKTVAIKAIKTAVEQMGWRRLGETETEAWRLEAVARTPLFGFRDDVVIRITEKNIDTRLVTIIDVRSASRVGLGDIGANAKRINAFYKTLEEIINSQG